MINTPEYVQLIMIVSAPERIIAKGIVIPSPKHLPDGAETLRPVGEKVIRLIMEADTIQKHRAIFEASRE